MLGLGEGGGIVVCTEMKGDCLCSKFPEIMRNSLKFIMTGVILEVVTGTSGSPQEGHQPHAGVLVRDRCQKRKCLR